MFFYRNALFVPVFVLFMTSCVEQGVTKSSVKSSQVEPSILGMPVGTVTVAELEGFAAGKELSILDDALSMELKEKSRLALNKEFHINSAKAAEAFASPAGSELVALIKTFISNKSRETEVLSTLIKACSDNSISFMELVKLYPDRTLGVNTITFGKDNKAMLDKLSDLESEYGK